MLGGATFSEIVFSAILVGVVLIAPLVPRLGAAAGRLLEKKPRD